MHEPVQTFTVQSHPAAAMLTPTECPKSGFASAGAIGDDAKVAGIKIQVCTAVQGPEAGSGSGSTA